MKDIVQEFLDRYPQCPNPLHYPKSADFFVNMMITVSQKKSKKEVDKKEWIYYIIKVRGARNRVSEQLVVAHPRCFSHPNRAGEVSKWSKEAVCKTDGERLRRFEPSSPHQKRSWQKIRKLLWRQVLQNVLDAALPTAMAGRVVGIRNGRLGKVFAGLSLKWKCLGRMKIWSESFKFRFGLERDPIH